MASFLDKPAKFNQYYEQIPTDAYVTVGMEKQRRYEDGVRQVNQYIQSLTELPVTKQADVQYLNQRVADLTTKINSAHSADWGNTALLNQAGSLASTIFKDPNIQNAVLSTQRIKQLQQSYKDLRDKHPDKYSQVNELYDMENAVGSYLASPNVGELYGGPTSARIGNVAEVTKRLTDMVSKVKANKATTIDPYGQMMYQIDEKTYVSEDQLRSMVQKTLSADDLDLLHRDAWYNLRQFSTNQLMDRFVADADGEISKRTRYLNSRDTGNALTKDSYLKNLDAQDIEAQRQYIDSLAARRNEYVNRFRAGRLNQNDISQMRDMLWNKNYIDGIAESGAYYQSSKTLKVNEEAKFALEKNFQKELNEDKFKQDLALKMSEKHPEVLSVDANGKISIDFGKLQAAIAAGGASILSPVIVDLNAEGSVNRINEASITNDINRAAAQRDQARQGITSYLRTIPEFQDYFDDNGNVRNTPEATSKIDEAISLLARQIKQKANGVPVTVPFMPKNEKQAGLIMQYALKAQEAQLAVDAAMNLESEANRIASVRAMIPESFGNERVTLTGADGVTKTYTVNDLIKIQNNAIVDQPPTVITGPGSRMPNVRYSSEFSNLVEGPSRDKLNQIMSTNRRFTELREREKGAAYDELSKVNIPLGRSVSLPEKNTDPTFIGLQNYLQTAIGNKAEAGSIRPVQTLQSSDGKKYMITQYKPANAKDAKKGLVTEAVDITQGVQFTPDSWLGQQFGADPNPDLTNIIERLPGKKTPLNREKGFEGSLFTNNFSTIHYYQISKARDNDFGKVAGKYYLTVAVPSPDGKTFSYEELANYFNLPADAQKYINGLFGSQASTETFYKTLTEKNK